jgi:hypothetical protein
MPLLYLPLRSFLIRTVLDIQNNLYIRILKYAHLTPIFQLFFTQKQMDIVHRKTGFNASFQDS